MTYGKILISLLTVSLLASSLTVGVLVSSLTAGGIGLANAQQEFGPTPSGDRAERNWEYVNHDSWATNYIPQTEINRDNVHLLELKWVFPFPAGGSVASRLGATLVQEGSIAPPLVVDGTLYVATNARDIFAFDLETGELKWVNEFEYDCRSAVARNPALWSCRGHVHGMNYFSNLNMLTTSNLFCTIRLVDAEEGEMSWTTRDQCLDIEGNDYDWPLYKGAGFCGLASHPGAIYQKENILITGFCGSDGATSGGRMFLAGYDLNFLPPQRIWTTFMQPPGDGDAEWALRNCDIGWFFSYKAYHNDGTLGIPCTEVPRENLMNDWGVPTHYSSAVSAQWGQQAVDEETGIIYLGTGNQGGYGNQTYTPGPNLYAASTLALDAVSGEILWWYQHVPRDMVEGDASWNTVLAEITIGGQTKKVVFKFTVTGLIWALDAATGEPLWIFEAPYLKSRVDSDGVKRGRSACSPEVGADPSSQDGFWNDPLSFFDMQEKKWLNYPSTGFACWKPVRGGEADIAFDKDSNTIYLPVNAGWDSVIKAATIGPMSQLNAVIQQCTTCQSNFTIFAIDATTGEEKWSRFFDGFGYRGGIMASGGVVYASVADGRIYMLDAETGDLLSEKSLGFKLGTQAIIGKTLDGKSRVIQTNGLGFTGARLGPLAGGIPGSVLVFGLPDDYVPPEVIVEEPEPEVIVEEPEPEVIVEEPEPEVIVEIPEVGEPEVGRTERGINPLTYLSIGAGIVVVVVVAILFARRRNT